MKFIENRSYQEIADIECVDIETIKKSILRSKKKMDRLQLIKNKLIRMKLN